MMCHILSYLQSFKKLDKLEFLEGTHECLLGIYSVDNKEVFYSPRFIFNNLCSVVIRCGKND